MRREKSDGESFRRAVILCVSTLGLKSLGQALKLARNGIQMDLSEQDNCRKLISSGSSKIPVGWEAADADMIDGVVILANEDVGDPSYDDGDEAIAATFQHSANTHDGSNLGQSSFASQKMVAEFYLDEIIGSVVSWRPDFWASDDSEKLYNIRYGVAVSIDRTTEMALVQTLPMLSETSSRKFGHLFNNESQPVMYSTNVGSTLWIPLRYVRFVSGRPTDRKLETFRRKLVTNMSHEMKSHDAKCQRDAQKREGDMEELKESQSSLSIAD